ncbi:MAG: IPT/TIG domain-containing protein [Cytophagales bacterium]|nr:IPT/TIG domain-containing protein [Cytophagales bacterium]
MFIRVLFLGSGFLLLFSCVEPLRTNEVDITLTDFNPKEAKVGSEITISGTQLKLTEGTSRVMVFFGDERAKFVSLSQTALVVEVPEIAEGLYDLRVEGSGTEELENDVVNMWDVKHVFEDKFKVIPVGEEDDDDEEEELTPSTLDTSTQTVDRLVLEAGRSPELVARASADHVRGFLEATGSIFSSQLGVSAGDFESYVRSLTHDIAVYRYEYKTTYLEEDLVVSGVISVPLTAGNYPILSHQNHTITSNRDAPSVVLDNHSKVISAPADLLQVPSQAVAALSSSLLSVYMAMAGLVVVIPDYIGFGSSRDKFHPYYLRDPTARTVVDGILAAHELVDVLDDTIDSIQIDASKDLYLMGYSQGGFSTIAVQRFLRKTESGNLDLKMAVAGAGGYDLSFVGRDILARDMYTGPAFLAYLFLSYFKRYNLSEGDDPFLVTDLFQEPYASKLESLFDPTLNLSIAQINTELGTDLSKLLNPDFRRGIQESTPEAQGPKVVRFLKLLEDNSLTDGWTPKAPLILYHGEQDEVLPISSSQRVFEVLNSLAPGKISFNKIPKGLHARIGVSVLVGGFVRNILPTVRERIQN